MRAPSCFRSAALLLALPALAACSGATDSADLPSVANPLDADRSAVVYQLNQVRSTAGLPAVTDCYTLNISASAHSDDLRDNAGTLPVGMTGSDGTDVRMRACTAGYKPACSGTPAMGEVVALGYGTGEETLAAWATDPTAGPIVKNGSFIVVGVGRSQGAMGFYWTMDLGSVADPSCTAP